MTATKPSPIMRQPSEAVAMPFVELVQEALKTVGGRVVVLSAQLEVSRQTIYKWLKGYPPGRINEAKLRKYLGYPQSDVVNVTELRQTATWKVPLIDQLKAGRGGVAVDPHPLGAAETYIEVSFEPSKETIALKLYGDSMEPDFMAGDIVIIDKNTNPEPGNLVVVELYIDAADDGQGEWTFKEYRPRGPIFEGFQAFDLVAFNPKCHTISINEPNMGRFIGTMIAYQKIRRR